MMPSPGKLRWWLLTGMLVGCASAAVEPATENAAAVVDAEPSPAATAAAPEEVPTLRDVESLRGVWRSANAPPGYLSYRFDGNGYTADGYPPWQESGRVEVVEVEGRRLLIRFESRIYDGKPDEDQQRWVALAADGRSFEMAGRNFSKLDYGAAVAVDPPASRADGGDEAAGGQAGSQLGSQLGSQRGSQGEQLLEQ